ncbi:hypothetical protein ACFX1R_042794 [Malus domestica]
MATVDKGVEIGKEKELKHLGFLRVAAIQTLVCVSNLYDYAKQNSGPLRSTVGTVEGEVTAVVGPVYRKFKGVPDDVLTFLNAKVDEEGETRCLMGSKSLTVRLRYGIGI